MPAGKLRFLGISCLRKIIEYYYYILKILRIWEISKLGCVIIIGFENVRWVTHCEYFPEFAYCVDNYSVQRAESLIWI